MILLKLIFFLYAGVLISLIENPSVSSQFDLNVLFLCEKFDDHQMTLKPSFASDLLNDQKRNGISDSFELIKGIYANMFRRIHVF